MTGGIYAVAHVSEEGALTDISEDALLGVCA